MKLKILQETEDLSEIWGVYIQSWKNQIFLGSHKGSLDSSVWTSMLVTSKDLD